MHQHFNHAALMQMEQRFRAAFINSLSGFKSINLLGSKNLQNQSNLAIFNSVMHIGANPPLMGIIVRPDSVERHSYENICETGFYTLNHIHKNIYRQAHQSAARYPRDISEFNACGLTEEYKAEFFAPFVKESNLQIALQLKETIKVQSNNTILLIGEIQHIFLPATAVQKDGFIDLECIGSLAGSGLDAYHQTNKLARLSYAKPNQEPQNIE